ncbi:MAG: hypothetical protein HY863_09730 [Chloroflexi bacterium]|nr:hypothetical protein [Chloroflexota bacterium]
MRSIGTVLFLMLFILVGFGFLLSDNLNVRRELVATSNQIAQVEDQLQAIQEQYNAVRSENKKLEDQRALLTQENSLLHGKIQRLQEENAAAKVQNTQLQAEVNFLKATASLLARLKIASSNSLASAILVPLFPISLGAAWILVSRNTRNSTRKKGNGTCHAGRSMQIKVTEEEMKQVVDLRRGKQ